MKVFTNKKTDPQKKETSNNTTTKDWLPFKDIIKGIVVLKDGSYVQILEIIPVNFKLKSKMEKKLLIVNYRAFLKACNFPMQINVQCQKADVEPHLQKVQQAFKQEHNENARHMMQGYMELVKSLGSKGAVSRRFFITIPYILPAGVKGISFDMVEKQLYEKSSKVKDYLKKCGNNVVDPKEMGENEFTAHILYSYLNRRNYDVQKFGGKLLALTGLFFDAREAEA